MDFAELKTRYSDSLEMILGHLNFSSGERSTKFLKALNELGQGVDSLPKTDTPRWKTLGQLLWQALDEKEKHSGAFALNDQARKVLLMALAYGIPFYRAWHKNLLFHQTEDSLFNPFALGEFFGTVLKEKTFQVLDLTRERPDFEPRENLSPDILFALQDTVLKYDDYIGYRPIPVLHSRQKMQPYRHEWVHAIPLYFQDTGVLHGKYEALVTRALEILRNTPGDLLQDAMFDWNHLEELSYDPRPLDFEHPVNRRLNYHFGGWDPTSITNKGYFNRFVLIEATLDSILSRVYGAEAEATGIPQEELLWEASAVLAGTMLMGSAVCGWGPGAFDSSVTFAVLLPRVAQLRDAFYDQLLKRIQGPHAARLQQEKAELHQPFARARQYFNHNLARMRAQQYQNVQLARLYAWMGFVEESQNVLSRIPVPSARMRCEIDCLMTQAHLDLDREKLEEAIPKLYRAEEILHEGIECGALLDPWYILGFGGQYPLSQSVEDSTMDMRVDDMMVLINSLFALYSRLLKETAAKGLKSRRRELQMRMESLTQWWDRFGTLDVGEVKSISGSETFESTNLVVDSLEAWYEGGTAAGDIAFWRPRVMNFTSSKAYTLLIEALLDQHDPVAAMALLIHWLSQSELIPLEDGDYSFHPLVLRWMEDLWYPPTRQQRMVFQRGTQLVDQWNLAKRLVDSLEANADLYGEIPVLDVSPPGQWKSGTYPMDPEEESELGFSEDLYRAAWEDVTYRDTTDDGIDSDMVNPHAWEEAMEDFPLALEMERLSGRLLFFITQSRLWKMAAVFSIPFADQHPDRSEVLQEWSSQASRLQIGLNKLIDQIAQYPIEEPETFGPVAMMEYEKRLGMKYTLLERTLATCCELIDAQHLMRIADVQNRIREIHHWESATACVIQSLICGDRKRIQEVWSSMVDFLSREPILFVPVERGGDPHRMLRIRTILKTLQRLLINLPRQGLLAETYRVLALVQMMEREHPTGMRAITRYDHLFDLGNEGIIQSILRSAAQAKGGKWKLRSVLPLLTSTLDTLIRNWISHSRGIRVSAVDTFQGHQEWTQLQEFIQEYGHDLFSPIQLNYGNLQAIHHQGVRNWLQGLLEEDEPEMGKSLVEAIREGKYPLEKAVFYLDAIFETLLERYGQFIDYNTTTTQSDRGENLYILFDFLRLMAEYDRIAWDLHPFVTTHSVMVREKEYEVADAWATNLEMKMEDWADRLLGKYHQLCQKYGVTLKSVYDRLSERFVVPMAINKLCAYLEPSIQEARSGGETPVFDEFLKLAEEFSQKNTGTGFEPPRWLEEIEEEVQSYRSRSEEDDEMLDLSDFIPQRLLKQREIRAFLEALKFDQIPNMFYANTPPWASLEPLKELWGLAEYLESEEAPQFVELLDDEEYEEPDDDGEEPSEPNQPPQFDWN
ncbi:MAG: hypothetical protein Q4D62_02550 [Planctomycetia bacterium]|nr:hypothetical protein [Planctomycetia bacterium]